ncbi:hypothetical protein LIQ46_05430 [Megasphaera elsdenii]|uniref:DUF7768 domain-containing protein n=1 Tax=Megasphaera elsdenii TaxID=907 RepID=UPI001D005DDB|nr:DUF4406 domain-containing protein [Megasphaera elsdenii]MCB5702398.1 hypothetical protein [Megasphaera elsdenii]MCB5727181.1 hypothetical protein [Megasphaera elsdenii]MCB5770961.1 hypothetical protein [Megasphaera elsdenii]
MNKFNDEHYLDPTPQQALSTIEAEKKAMKAYRPLVYVCSPYSGDTLKNTENARRYSRFAFEQGRIPIAPHLLFTQFLDDYNPIEREMGMHFGNVLMSLCREVWVFGDIISPGMDAEIRRARWKNYRLKFFTNDLEEVER